MKHSQGKLLVVSQCIFPQRGGSAIIMEKLARNFSRDEMVMLGELSMFGRPQLNRPSNGPEFCYFRSGISLAGRGARFFAPLRWQLFPLLVQRICRLAWEKRCTHILGVYPDEMYCYAAHQASVKLQLPLSTYFHNTYLDNVAVDRRRASQIQPQLFERSECVFVMSEGMKKHYDATYELRKCVPLVHTFERFPELQVTDRNSPRSDRTNRLVLFGNFNESNLEATKRFVDAASGNGRYEINVYTDVPRPLLRHRGIDVNRIKYRGFVDDARLIDELQQYDVSILTHGFTGAYGEVEYRTIFPTRTIPMLLSGKPILVHSPPGTFVTNFFRANGCGAIVDEPSPDKILQCLGQIVDDGSYRAELVAKARETAEQFYGPNVANILRKHVYGSSTLECAAV